MNRVVLCCGKNGCPVLSEVEESKTYTITDDFGGRVVLSKEEIDMLVKEWRKPEWSKSQKSTS